MTITAKLKTLSLVLTVIMLLSCFLFTGITASAAQVTDGENFYLAGDVDTSGTIDICDLVAAHIGTGNTIAADLDGTGDIGSYDYALIRAILLGIDKSQWTENTY